ncbi:CaiB/BaiF CoA transferase family protein [Chloroflexota bacterium]
MEMMAALEGIKVVEVARVIGGPLAGRFLAEWGAEVLHIEHPITGDESRYYVSRNGKGKVILSDINYSWENNNRSKKGVTIDLSQERGKEILHKLVEKADVFLTNLRPRDLKKFNAEYDTLCRVNHKLIYACLTGYGRKGPDRNLPGFDLTGFWARAGIMNMLSEPGKSPPFSRPGFGDTISGMALALGIVTALFARERTGIGQEVDVSLFNTGVFVLSYDIAGSLVTGQDFQQRERKEVLNPLTNFYQTKDGRWLYLAMVYPDRYWSRACNAIEREDLEHDPQFESFEARVENHTALFTILEETFLSKTLAEWKDRFNEAGLPYAPAQKLTEVTADPQARANDFFATFDHPTYGPIEVIACPIKLSKTPASIRTPAPEFSQHTEQVLLEHGYTWEDIEQFKQQGIIA